MMHIINLICAKLAIIVYCSQSLAFKPKICIKSLQQQCVGNDVNGTSQMTMSTITRHCHCCC